MEGGGGERAMSCPEFGWKRNKMEDKRGEREREGVKRGSFWQLRFCPETNGMSDLD